MFGTKMVQIRIDLSIACFQSLTIIMIKEGCPVGSGLHTVYGGMSKNIQMSTQKDGNEWHTTTCHILSAGVFNLVSEILFVFYGMIFLLHFLLWFRNIRACLTEFEMIKGTFHFHR